MAKIVVIGAGNVGYHLVRMFLENAHQVVQLVSSSVERAKKIVDPLPIPVTDDFNEIADADVYVLSVADNYVSEYSQKLQIPKGKLVVHTSGVLSKDCINDDYTKGVFYPLQTFTKGKGIDYAKVPIFYEGENAASENLLKQIAKTISDRVYSVSEEKRKQMHVAAVFANNFTNHMFSLAESICRKNNIEFDVLRPLIQETVDKIDTIPPSKAQTGPAVRKDHKTIENHLQLLQNNNWKEVYQSITNSIIKNFDNEL